MKKKFIFYSIIALFMLGVASFTYLNKSQYAPSSVQGHGQEIIATDTLLETDEEYANAIYKSVNSLVFEKVCSLYDNSEDFSFDTNAFDYKHYLYTGDFEESNEIYVLYNFKGDIKQDTPKLVDGAMVVKYSDEGWKVEKVASTDDISSLNLDNTEKMGYENILNYKLYQKYQGKNI